MAPPDAASCGASRLAGFVGGVPEDLDPTLLPQVVRVLRPGDMMTEDYSAARLNVMVNDKGRIREFWCG